MSKPLTNDVAIWAHGSGVLPNVYSGCNGTCYLQVPAAGFEINCTAVQAQQINWGHKYLEIDAIEQQPSCLYSEGLSNASAACTAAWDWSQNQTYLYMTSIFVDKFNDGTKDVAASAISCVLCVLPVYWKYWELGRAVTLGPFEIAASFQAPGLYHPANAPLKMSSSKSETAGCNMGRLLRVKLQRELGSLLPST